MPKTRCVNIDWLEVFTREPSDLYPMNADFFEKLGFIVHRRAYGTPQYREMFTLCDDSEFPLFEIRRNPYSIKDEGGIFYKESCHIRLSNRHCYEPDPVGDLRHFLQTFRYHYLVKGQPEKLCCVSRIDICLDFLKFDTGENPRTFLANYMRECYCKITQPKFSPHGTDHFDGKVYNSIKWGSPSSMVSTKMYNKTLEMREKGDKPYIRQAWVDAGLLYDLYDEVTVWRLEFSISSDCKQWISDSTERDDPSGAVLIVPNTLETFDNRAKLLQVFHSLQAHYFRFVIKQPGVRKYRCKQKVTFRRGEEVVYRPRPLQPLHPKAKPEKMLLNRLKKIEETSRYPDAMKLAADLIRAQLLEEYSYRAFTGADKAEAMSKAQPPASKIDLILEKFLRARVLELLTLHQSEIRPDLFRSLEAIADELSIMMFRPKR